MDEENGAHSKIVQLIREAKPARQTRKRVKPAVSISGDGNVVGDGNTVVNGNVIHTTRSPKIVHAFTPGPQHIEEAQALRLRELVDEVVKTEALIKKTPANYAQVWSAFYKKMKVASYRALPREKFDDARLYLQQWLGRLSSARSAPRKLGSDWRKKRYTAIKTRVRKSGLEDWYNSYLLERFQATSLTDLSDQDLQTVYGTVMSKK